MAKDYPFPIPETILKDTLASLTQAGPPWGDLDEWKDASDELTSFGYFDNWRYHTGNLMQNLQHAFSDVVPVDYESPYNREKWAALEGAISALGARLNQFAGLLAWARCTWKYDPETLKLMSPQDLGEETSEKEPRLSPDDLQ